jgi:hypothetical protein
MNIEYASFPGLGFQGKNIYVMCVFSIVYLMVVVDWVRRVLELSTSDASDHQMLIVVPSPM